LDEAETRMAQRRISFWARDRFCARLIHQRNAENRRRTALRDPADVFMKARECSAGQDSAELA